MTGPLHVVSVQTSHEQGGGEYANVDLLDGLAARGHTVRLVTNQPGLGDGRDLPISEIELGPKLNRVSRSTVLPRLPLYAARVRAALREATRKNGPVDVTMLHYKKEQLLTPALGRAAGAPVWFEWGPVPFEMRQGPGRLAYAFAGRRAKRMVAVSQGTKDSIVDCGLDGSLIDVVPPMTDVETVRFDAEARERLRAEWGCSPDTFVVGCVSRLNAKKRNDVVLDSLDHLDGDVLVVLMGDGDKEDELRARAARHGDRVRFIPTPRGYVEQPLSACDLQVFAGQETEGAPRAIAFGFLCGRPVVACSPMGADLIVPGTGAVIERENDAASLAATLARYRDDRDLCAREGQAGLEHVLREYAPARIIDAVERAFFLATGRTQT